MKQRYSRNYYPPSPVLEVRLAVPNGERVGPLPALVDTGADGTLVPLEYLLDILAPSTDEALMRSQWGEGRLVHLYLVDVEINGDTLPGLEVVGDEMTREIILGRDVLNKLNLVLDGPQEMVEVLT